MLLLRPGTLERLVIASVRNNIGGKVLRTIHT